MKLTIIIAIAVFVSIATVYLELEQTAKKRTRQCFMSGTARLVE